MTARMLDQPWSLSDDVSLRPEPFGALAYHFGTRRLTFVKRPELVQVLMGLAQSADVCTALTRAGVQQDDWPPYLAALESLAGTDIIRLRHSEPEGVVE